MQFVSVLLIYAAVVTSAVSSSVEPRAFIVADPSKWPLWNCEEQQQMARGILVNDANNRSAIQATGGVGMKTTLDVLSIGSQDSCNTVRDVLLQRHNCRLSVVTSLWNMYAIPERNNFDIAILHHTLSRLEVRNASEHIRRRWPGAKILVISAEMDAPDDPLYDERLPPGQSPGTLLATIEQLTSGAKESCTRNA
jgi:hypothetical protein